MTCRFLLGSLLCLPLAVQAAEVVNTPALNFADARTLVHSRADALKMTAAETAHREHAAQSARSLRGPKVTLDVKQMWGRKTMDFGTLSLPNPAASLAPVLGQMLPPQQLGQLAGLASPTISMPLSMTDDLSGPRATAAFQMPLFTGGAITAKIAASDAAVYESRADERVKRDELDARLAHTYFGVQLARSVERLRADMLEQEEKELSRAERFEKTGMISRIERMSVQVNRDAAKRELLAAVTDRTVAETELSRLMHEATVDRLDTSLFVVTKSLGTLDEWQQKALAHSPVLRSIQAKMQMADQGVAAAKAAWWPQIYAFGQGNLIDHYLSLTEPDWVAGIGMKITLWDNKDRNASVASARSLVTKAQAARDEAVNQLATKVETAYLRTEQARHQYYLTLSTIDLARENLKLREKSFAEGLSTATDVSQARTQLVGAEIARRVAAYRFVVSWAMLHAVTGTMDEFVLSANDHSNIFE